MIDSLDFAEALTNDSPYDYMEKELARDMRRNKTRGDISERYQGQIEYYVILFQKYFVFFINLVLKLICFNVHTRLGPHNILLE